MTGLLLTLLTTLALPGTAHADYVTTPTPFGWQAPAPVHAVEVAGSRMYVGTYDENLDTNPGKLGRVVALDAASGQVLWSVATSGGDVFDIAVSGGKVFVGGNFTTVGGADREHLAALAEADGSVIDGWAPRTNREVHDVHVSGDTVYIGGTFERINGEDQAGVGAVDATSGERIAGFAAHVDGNVYSLAAVNGRLIAAGGFTAANGVPRSLLASFALDTGALDTWAPDRLCADCSKYLDVATDGTNVYVASAGVGGHLGAFRLADGAKAWPAVTTNGNVQVVSVGSDGLVYMGGHFSRYVKGDETIVRKQVAAVDAGTGALDPDFAPDMVKHFPGVWVMVQMPGRLVVGGDFDGVRRADGTVVSKYLAMFAAKTPPADPCAGLANCRTVANVDVNGDAVRDAVVMAQRAGGFTLRVQTSTGTRSTVSLATRRWKGDAWQGSANLDTRKGRDLMVGRVIEGSTRKFTALTWRGSRLVVLDAPGTGSYWTVSSSARTKAGWLKPRTAPKGTVVRRVATRIRTSKVYRGKAITYRHTSRGWVAKSSTTKRRMTATAAGRWGGFSVSGLGRW